MLKNTESCYGNLVENIVEDLVWFNIRKEIQIENIMDFVILPKETSFFPLTKNCILIILTLHAVSKDHLYFTFLNNLLPHYISNLICPFYFVIAF